MGKLKSEECWELWKENPTQENLEKLWLSVVGLVKVLACNYFKATTEFRGERLYDIDDLIQAGFFAVYDAARRKQEGYSFNSTLYYCVKNRFGEVAGIRKAFANSFGKVAGKSLHADAISLNERIGLDDGDERLELLADPAAEFEYDIIKRIAIKQDFDAMLKEIERLPDMQKNALMLTAYEGLSAYDAGCKMGVTAAKVGQLRYTACSKLRKTKTGKLLSNYYT